MNERQMFEPPNMNLDGDFSVFVTSNANRRVRKIAEVYSRSMAVQMLTDEAVVAGYVLDYEQRMIAHKNISKTGSVAVI